MVKLTEIDPQEQSERWLDSLTARLPQPERDLVMRAHGWAQQH